MMAISSSENLERLAGLVGPGTINVYIQESYSLKQAGEAMNVLGVTHTQGKLGVQLS